MWLYPSRLNINLDSLEGRVTDVEIDIADYCGAGCTAAFLYQGNGTIDSDSNTLVSQDETLHLSGLGYMANRLAVSSCEGAVMEIRINVRDVPVIKGCIQLKGAPVVGSKVILSQEGETNKRSRTNDYGCYKFETAVSGKDFMVIINGPVIP